MLENEWSPWRVDSIADRVRTLLEPFGATVTVMGRMIEVRMKCFHGPTFAMQYAFDERLIQRRGTADAVIECEAARLAEKFVLGVVRSAAVPA